MKKVLFSILLLVIGLSAMAQQSIQLRSVDRVECVTSDYRQLNATFSFSTLEANTIETTRGELSELHIEGTYPNGNVGEPQLPMFTRLIAIPTGATPLVSVGAHSETEYTLSDYGIGTVAAMQAPVRKSIDPGTVEYAFSEEAYARDSYNDDPVAMVEVLGTMRGITLGRLIVQPVRYNPVAGTVKVFNDIEVSVDFQGGDADATERMFKNTANVAFQSVYDQIFNIGMLMGGPTRDAYTDHPDFYNTPVKMLVICYSGFEGNSALNEWLQWKLQKGYYVDVYYTGSGSNNAGTTASAIASFIKTKYNASVSAGNAYTYLIVIGDTGQVPQYMSKSIDSSIGSCASDLGYASVNFSSSTSNYFPDMYYSRMSVENTTHLENYINKVLTYERFEFSDGGNYLNNVILVGGWDSSWTSRVAKPTINYGTNYYFNSSNTTYGGFSGGTINATISTSSTQGYSGTNNGCYNGINNGVCFLNYTAHGDKQEWYQPKMTAAHVATLTNTGKYFFAVGNCCLTGNFNNTTTTYSPGSAIGTNACFAETMIRVPNAGAIAYVGCSPYSYWYEDFYWAVGAHSYSAGNYPTTTSSTKGVYDVMFMDQYWNSASALNYVGNLAVQQAVTNGNTNSSITDGDCNNSAHYYFQFYHTFGDGSVMPYVTKPEANTVTIPSTVTPGTTSITVNAVAGSYVAVTDNSSVIYGVAEANSSGVATVTFTNAIPTTGTLYVVVTRQQYQPYFGTITVAGGTQYEITATANPSNGGTVSGAGHYYGSTSCTLTATANTHYEFVNWTKNGTQVSTENPYTFTVTGNATYVANFTALSPHTVTCNAVENGTIGASPTTAYKNETVTLTATPATGYYFSAWDVRDASNNPITATGNQFTMPDSDVTVSATFVSGCTVAVAEVEHGTVAATPAGGAPGTTVTLTAMPDTDYFLSTWLVFKTGDVNTVVTVTNNQFTLPAYDVTVVGIFKLNEIEDVTIGSGTSTNNYIPTYAYYDYSFTQQIYKASEVGTAGTITKIAFKNNSSNSTSRNMDIYLKHTTKTAFTTTSGWESVSSTDLAFSGTVTFVASGWTTIILDTPFAYDGTNNLLLCVDDNTGSWVSSVPQYLVYSTNENRAMRVYRDSNDFIPSSASSYTGTMITSNNQVTFTMQVGGASASLAVAPNAMDGFSYAEGYGPSAVKSVAVIGTDLTGDITVTAPDDYEVSDAENGTYGNSVTLAAGNRGNRETLTYDFEDGWQNWTTFQGSTTSPNSWMHNTEYPTTNNNFSSGYGYNSSDGFMLSESYISGSSSGSGTAVTPDNYLVSPQVTLGGSITFQAGVQNVSYCAEKFSVMVSTTGNNAVGDFTTVQTWTYTSNASSGSEWQEFTVDLSAYSGMGYIAIRHFDCYDQWILKVDDVTIVEGGEPINPTNPTTDLLAANVYVRLKGGLDQGSYSETLTATTGDIASNVGLNGEVFGTLAAGWNWWAPTKVMTLSDLETALDGKGIVIDSQDGGFVRYENNTWSGTLSAIDPGQMYKVKTSEAVSLTLTGEPTAASILEILPGYNWFGYTGSQSKSVATAFSGFAPANGDRIIAQNGAEAVYNDGWSGTLTNLVPGKGYVYISNAQQSRTITFE